MPFQNSLPVARDSRRSGFQSNRVWCAAVGVFAFSLFPGGCDKSSSEKGSKPAATRPASYKGHVETANDKGVFGWAWDKNHPEQVVQVDIYDGDNLLGAVKADLFRADLKKSGHGDGKHGFGFRWPAKFKDQKDHAIWVKISGTDVKLNATELVIGAKQPESNKPNAGKPASDKAGSSKPVSEKQSSGKPPSEKPPAN